MERDGHGSVSATLVVASTDGDVTALRSSDGATLWQYMTDPDWSSLASSKGVIYVASHVSPDIDGEQPARLTALRVRDGGILWQKKPRHLGGYTNIIVDGDVIVASSNMGDGDVCAFDAPTGRLRWSYGNFHGLRRLRDPLTPWGRFIAKRTGSTPGLLMDRLIDARAGLVYVSENEPPYPPHLTALTTRSCVVRWRYRQSIGRVIMTKGGAHIALENVSYKPEYDDYEASMLLLDAANGSIWGRLILPNATSLLAITDQGIAYFMIAETCEVAAIRFHDGAELWRSAGVQEPRSYRNPPYADSQVVITDEMLCYVQLLAGEWIGEVTALDVHTGDLLWRWYTPPGLSNSINAMSLIGGQDTVYLGTRLGLFALAARDGRQRWHALPTTDLSFIAPVLSPGQEA